MRRWAEQSRVKCNCGHYPKDHYNREGWCGECACTWYYPNDKYILRKQKEKKMKKKGFTLIEILIVVAIIGILAGIAVPRLLELKQQEETMKSKVDLKRLYMVISSYYLENSVFPETWGDLGYEINVNDYCKTRNIINSEGEI